MNTALYDALMLEDILDDTNPDRRMAELRDFIATARDKSFNRGYSEGYRNGRSGVKEELAQKIVDLLED